MLPKALQYQEFLFPNGETLLSNKETQAYVDAFQCNVIFEVKYHCRKWGSMHNLSPTGCYHPVRQKRILEICEQFNRYRLLINSGIANKLVVIVNHKQHIPFFETIIKGLCMENMAEVKHIPFNEDHS